MTRILCFGDSITFASSDPGGGWTNRLSNNLAATYMDVDGNNMHSVYNLGVDAHNTNDLLSRIDHEIKARSTKGLVIIIFIGANDASRNDKHESQVEIRKYEANLTRCIEIAKKHTDKVILVGLMPVLENEVGKMDWAQDPVYRIYNADTKQYNVAANKVAHKEDIYFEDIYSDFKKLDMEQYLSDGLHPNGIGQQYIADRLKKKVAEMANDY